MPRPLSIWILDPYHSGSHAAWADGCVKALGNAGHNVILHALPGRHWKWRMHGAAAIWAQNWDAATQPPDLILTTDMCDVAQLKGLMPRHWTKVKVAVMFHENQLTFPWSPTDPDPEHGRDNHYAYLNLSTGLAADQVWFNSAHHRTVFLEAAKQWMERMPKPKPKGILEKVKAKSKVLPLGLHLEDWDQFKPQQGVPSWSNVETPILLWNQRWSWDKGTDAWMHLVDSILQRDIPAEFVVMGKPFERVPDGWESMKEKMGRRCLHWGFVESDRAYIEWLWRCTIAPLSPKQEFFGLAVVEAMRCQTLPWVPKEHAYSETMPEGHLFLSEGQWMGALEKRQWQDWPLKEEAYESQALQFEWSQIQGLLNDMVQALLRDEL